jgi:hypothetical protein
MKEETKVEQKKEESLKSKIILPIDRLEQDEDGVRAVRIKAFKYKDVKKAVLEFKNEFLHSEEFESIKDLYMVSAEFNRIFGDFEK